MVKVILYVAISLDGFIADKEGGVDWLPQTPDAQDVFGYQAMLKRISSIVMGSKSYQQILGFGEWAWGGKQTYVFTTQDLPVDRPDVHLVRSDVREFMGQLAAEEPDQAIWLLGGAALAHSFADVGLIDECIVTVVPHTLGEGIPLIIPYEDFVLLDTKSDGEGTTQYIYIRSQ
jgi:dihydrofolate reductase